MKKSRFIFRSFSFALLLTGLLFHAGAFGCGDSGRGVLTIDPSQATVKLGATQQFTSNKGKVNWQVVGGDLNGTIDESGLYTAPTLMPVSPEVTIEANLGVLIETATVHLDAP